MATALQAFLLRYMECPRCKKSLKIVSVDGVTVDACQNGCGGIWFDAFELEKMDQPDESAGWLLDNLRIDLSIEVDFKKQVECPRCDGVKLMQQKYPANDRIAIDKCRVCGGVWLDFGELFQIRSANPSTAEANKRVSSALLRGLKSC